MYTALFQFKDIDGETYNAGDTYPHECLTKKRIRHLSTGDNRTGAPVIAVVEPTLDQLLHFAAEKGIDIPPHLTTVDEIKAFVDEAIASVVEPHTNPLPEGFHDFNKAQLEEYAAAIGVDIGGAKNNDERRAILQEMSDGTP